MSVQHSAISRKPAKRVNPQNLKHITSIIMTLQIRMADLSFKAAAAGQERLTVEFLHEPLVKQMRADCLLALDKYLLKESV